MFVGIRVGAKVVAAVCVFAACGEYAPTGPQGGPLSGGGGANSLHDDSPVILLYDYGVSTGGVTIPVGTAVEWKNASGLTHSVSNYSIHPQAAVWEDTLLPPGGEFSYLFDQPGEYGFICIFHQDVGYITVVDPNMDMDMMDDDMDMDMDMDMMMDMDVMP